MPDDVAGAHERRAFNRAREHRAGRQRAAHQPFRQNRKPDARRDRAHQRLCAGALPEGRDGQIARLKDRIQKGAAGAALFPQKQIAGRYIREGEYVYYVHSYYGTNCAESTLAVSDYSIPVTGVVRAGRVYGTQFHPEKSGDTGLRILKAFSEL